MLKLNLSRQYRIISTGLLYVFLVLPAVLIAGNNQVQKNYLFEYESKIQGDVLHDLLPSRLQNLSSNVLSEITINSDVLALERGAEVIIRLNGEDEVFVTDRIDLMVSGNKTWVGYLKADRSKLRRAILTFGEASNQGGVIGRIQTQNSLFQVDTYRGINYLVSVIASEEAISEADAVFLNQQQADSDVNVKIDDIAALFANANDKVEDLSIAILDMIIYYTEGMAYAYPYGALQTRLDFLIAYANQVFVNSDVYIRYRLVKTIYSDYAETNDVHAALSYLKNNVDDDRELYGADMAVMMGYMQPTACGVANIPAVNKGDAADLSNIRLSSAISVTCGGSRTFVHETAHNLGSRHGYFYDVNTGTYTTDGAATYPYNYGHHELVGDFYTFMGDSTKMTNVSPVALDIHSNPRKQCQGQNGIFYPCGVEEGEPNQADNALAFNKIRFKVRDIQATQIPMSLTPSAVNVQLNQIQQFVAVNEDLTTTNIIYSVLTPNCGSIVKNDDGTGTYTAPSVAQGNCVITATNSVSGQIEQAVVNVIYGGAVSITPATIRTSIGRTIDLSAFINTVHDDLAVNWQIVETNAGTVDENGIYTAPVDTIGSFHVTVTDKNDSANQSTALIIVDHAVVVSPEEITLELGQQQQFTAKLDGTLSDQVIWSATIGNISPEGVYTAPLIPGTYSVKATSTIVDSSFDESKVIVTLPIASIVITPNSITAKSGEPVEFTATTTAVPLVQWSLDEGDQCGSLSQSSGSKVTLTLGMPEQICHLRASNISNIEQYELAVVTIEAVYVNISPESISLLPGENAIFTAAVNAVNQNVNWSVLEPNCGEITENGVYTASEFGGVACTVRATSQLDIQQYAEAVIIPIMIFSDDFE